MELPCGHPDRWEEEAKAALAYTSQSLFHAHRGAIPWLIRETSIIFANVGYNQDEHARQEVDVLRRMLRDQNIRELGFALDADGYSWVLLVHSDSAAELNDLIWKAAVVSGAPGGNGVQRPIAQTAICQWTRTLTKLLNSNCYESGLLTAGWFPPGSPSDPGPIRAS